MLLSTRAAGVPELDASVATTALVHTGYRVHVIHNRGVVCDDELFLPSIARVGRVSRSVLTVIVEGRGRVRLPSGFERWLEAGDVVLLPEKAIVAMRQEGSPSFRSVALEWDPGTFGATVASAPDVTRLDGAAMARVARVATALESCRDAGRAATLLADLVSLLGSRGAPFARVVSRDLIEPAPQAVVALSHALDHVLSSLDGGPALVDLDAALGLSPRQLNRVVADFNQRYGFNSLGWRDTRNRRRLLVGATMMTAAGARTELVSRAMGYASPTGFCHAFALAGLPSPGITAETVASLR
jgi:hypothetical protein